MARLKDTANPGSRRHLQFFRLRMIVIERAVSWLNTVVRGPPGFNP